MKDLGTFGDIIFIPAADNVNVPTEKNKILGVRIVNIDLEIPNLVNTTVLLLYERYELLLFYMI